jgi:hypothetical protein
VNGAVVYVPDYYGRYVLVDTFDSKSKLATATILVDSNSCNPNALTVQGAPLYVVCNSESNHGHRREGCGLFHRQQPQRDSLRCAWKSVADGLCQQQTVAGTEVQSWRVRPALSTAM